MKEFIRKILQHFFVINTAVTIGCATFITCLQRNAQLGVKILWQIIIVSFLTALTTVMIDSQKEIDKRQFIIRTIINYITVNIIVISCGYLFEWIEFGEHVKLFGLILCIFLIYVFVWVVSYKNDLKIAKKINERIQEYNKEL